MSPSYRKRSMYVSSETLEEIRDVAKRQGRSLSWVLQEAWRVAKEDIKKLPDAEQVDADP